MFGLGFLAPVFLAGLLAVAIPVLLHLFRRRTDRVVDFPAMQMLPEAPVERQERRRLRDLLLLALRSAALALLAVSFARPYLPMRGATLTAPATVVAIDTSLSLGGAGTWAEARPPGAGRDRRCAGDAHRGRRGLRRPRPIWSSRRR